MIFGYDGSPSAAVLWASTDVDTASPNPARVYDYLLGGAHNFARDRVFGDRIAEVVPARECARNNRAFLGRAVRYLVLEAGIRQFLDLGSGVPTVGNVHEIAQQASPDCRVVYVDHEPVAVAQSEALLARNELATVIQADLQQPATVLGHPWTQRLLDFSQPVGLLMCGVLHFIPDEADPAGIVAAYRQALCAGSHLAISHATADDYPIEVGQVVDMFKETNTPAAVRTREQVTRLFSGFALLEPGVVYTKQWRPELGVVDADDAHRALCYAGVGAL